MGRFSCFYGHGNSHKQKKLSQPSFETMIKKLQLGSGDHASVNPTSMQKLHMVENDANHLENGGRHAALPSCGWESGELECRCHAESNPDSAGFGMASLKRSLSVGCGGCHLARISCGICSGHHSKA